MKFALHICEANISQRSYFTWALPNFTRYRRISLKKESKSFDLLFFLEVPPRFELGMTVLQTGALPLGYGTIFIMLYYYSKTKLVCQEEKRFFQKTFLKRGNGKINGGGYRAYSSFFFIFLFTNRYICATIALYYISKENTLWQPEEIFLSLSGRCSCLSRKL